MPFLPLFNVDSHRIHIPHIVQQFLHGSSARIIRGLCVDYLRRSTQLSTAIRVEQARNSAEKVFRVTYRKTCSLTHTTLAHLTYTAHNTQWKRHKTHWMHCTHTPVKQINSFMKHICNMHVVHACVCINVCVCVCVCVCVYTSAYCPP